MLHTLNVGKISAKEHQLADSCAADEISVSENCFGDIYKIPPEYYAITKI